MVHGTIARRVLLNYRIDPDALRRVLPAPFRPNLYRGMGIGGVCMIRFEALRPRLVPSWLGISSENAAGFFSLGATGYSATSTPGRFHGLELRCLDWTIEPLAVEEARSRFVGDSARFPAGTVELDCALLMRGIEHEWHSRPDLWAERQ